MSETPIFDALFQGPSNRFARSALNAVAHMPGEIYNPLWLYGPSGVGKTAMLHATADALRDHPSHPLILHIQAERLIQDMIHAIDCGCKDDFRARILSFQVIVVDHADYLVGLEATQHFIGKLLAEAVSHGAQVILASCRHPAELDWLEKILSKTCEWKLCCDIVPPSFQERQDITRHLAQSAALVLPEPMVCRIAGSAHTPARINCILQHLAARQKLLQEDPAGLAEALENLLTEEAVA